MKIKQSPPQSQQKPLDINVIQYSYSKKIATHLINAFYLIRSFNKTCKSVYFSQAYIGWKLGLSANRACEIVKILEDSGYIRKYYRQSKTCEYEINPYYLQEEQEFRLNRFRKQFLAFSVFLISSINAVSDVSRQLNAKGFNLFNCTSTTVQKSTTTLGERGLYIHDPTWYYQQCGCEGCTIGAIPNKKLSSLEFEALLESTNMAQTLLPFTEEQLVQLAQYPKVSLEYANKLITRDLLGGKTIHNQFNYFLAIVQAHVKNNPETGKSGAYSRSDKASTVPLAEVQAIKQRQQERYQQFLDRREQKSFDRLVDLGYDAYTLDHATKTDTLNRDRMSYYTGEDCSFKPKLDV